MFGILKRKKRVNGLLGYFGLGDWWFSAFTEQERTFIEKKYQPMGSSKDVLTAGKISYTSESVVQFLGTLAGWFAAQHERAIAYRILQKAEELCDSQTPTLDAHFLFGNKLELYYKDRDEPEYFSTAVDACRQQIALSEKAARAFRAQYPDESLPGHKGFQQLAIILEKEGRFDEALEICTEAAGEGWAGDWTKRIERCRKKADSA